MSFEGLPRALLEAVSRAAGEEYRDVDGAQIVAAMADAGHAQPSQEAFKNAMFRLRDDDYLTFERMGGTGFDTWQLVRLVGPGLELVDSWPRRTLPTLDDQAVQGLLEAIGGLADRDDLSDDEREAATTIKEAGQTVGYSLLSSVLVIWLQARGLLPTP